VLLSRFDSAELVEDVRAFSPPTADVVAGGWPCQDISIGGSQIGLGGARSGLFYELLRVAEVSGATTIVAENVPNLLRMARGQAFREVVGALRGAGFRFVAWRTLNSRAFGLPHERKRVFIVAGRGPEAPHALFRDLPGLTDEQSVAAPSCSGFYWTAGTQSICYSTGFSPTLKVGSGLSIPSPPAVHYGSVVRKITAVEALRLQGFGLEAFAGVHDTDLFRMAGNAVSLPVGQWVMDTAEAPESVDMHIGRWIPEGPLEPSGIVDESGAVYSVETKPGRLCNNLESFVDMESTGRLSLRAASGLLRRLERSGKNIPDGLHQELLRLSRGDT
jgi:DNA (cytosine-5)-methyltransferase 1